MPLLSLIYTTSLRSLPSSKAEEHAKLRHIAANLLFVAGEVSGVLSPTIKSSSFYHMTGVKWHELRKFDLASSCFERATDLLSKIGIDTISDADEKKLFLDLSNARSKTAWEVSDRNLAVALLNSESSSLNKALKLMNEALELYEKGLREARTREETADLKASRSKTLRFISATVHLQMNEFESVIKCVRVLRDGDAGDHHPSLPMMAMKAWLGLGKYGEAEKELMGMVVNNGIPKKAMLYIRGLVAQGHGGSLLQ